MVERKREEICVVRMAFNSLYSRSTVSIYIPTDKNVCKFEVILKKECFKVIPEKKTISFIYSTNYIEIAQQSKRK